MKPTEDENFCRVFELPDSYPEGFCFDGGQLVCMRMVDWFYPWPDEFVLVGDEYKSPKNWSECKILLEDFLKGKKYVKPGRTYLLITEFGESFLFSNKGLLGGEY